MDTNDEFRQIAERMFGPACSRPTSLLLDVNPRTAERWLSGSFEVPPERLAQMREHLAQFLVAEEKLLTAAAEVEDQVDFELYVALIRKLNDAINSKD